MSWPEKLVLVRHAESEGNVMKMHERAQAPVANYKFPLTDRGRRQAAITGEYLKQAFGRFDCHYCSYYERARQTIKIICPNEKIIEDARLAEAQRGIWHTMTQEQIESRFPEEIKRKEKEDLYHYRPLGGENWPDIELRIHSFLDMLSRESHGKKILVVTHGNWLITFQKVMQNLSIEEALAMLHQDVFANASVLAYSSSGQKRLELELQDIVPWQGLV